MENITRKEPLPEISTQNAIAQISKTKYSWSYIFVQEVPRMHFMMIWAKSNFTKQLNKLGLQIELNQFLILKTMLTILKFQIKIW